MIKQSFFVMLLALFGWSLTACSHLPQQPNETASGLTDTDAQNETTDVAVEDTVKLPIIDSVIEKTATLDSFEQTLETSASRFDLPIPKPAFASEFEQALIFTHDAPQYQDLWQKLSQNLFIAPAHKPYYQDYQTYYLRNKRYLKRVSTRAKPYLFYIISEVEKRHMPMEVALLPIVESGYYPYARSYVSASGLWQFMPATGHMYGLNRNWWYDGRQDVYKSTQAALNYLQALYKQNDYDWLLALASYNSGYGNVLKAKKRYLKKHPNDRVNFWKIRPYLPKETQHYVPQLLAISNLVIHREDFELELTPIPNQPYFAEVEIKHQLSLPKIANATGMALNDIKLLNPGFLRLATPPKTQHTLLLPIKVVDEFENNYLEKPSHFSVNWVRHTIQSGESLSVIAQNYKTSSREIRNLNGMKNSFLRAGKTLLIPVPQNYQMARNSLPKKTYSGKIHRHKVQNGESLWTIARYYNVTTRKLCEWNRISIKAPLRKGQELVIRSNQYGKKVSHTIRKGESLWVVAQKYQVTTKQLCHWNGIKQSQVLQPGTTLKVWVKS